VTGRPTLSDLLPVPFLAVVVLLVILIFLTPNLVSSGSPPAGSLATQAELVVDHVTDSNVTHLYVKSLGTVRFASIEVELAKNVSWPVRSAHPIVFGNGTVWKNSLSAAIDTSTDPFAVNVSAVYVDASGVGIEYVGMYAFQVSGQSLLTTGLSAGEAQIPATPFSSLPLFILLTGQAPEAHP
jgi:hypothetical protein